MNQWARLAAVVALVAGAAAAGLVEPVAVATWTPGADSSRVAGFWPAGRAVLFSNCVVYAAAPVGTNAAAPMDLTAVGGFLTLGGVAWTNAMPTAPVVVLSATGGTFWASLSVPAWTNLVAPLPSSVVTVLPVHLTLTNAAGAQMVFHGVKALSVVRPVGP